MSTSLSVGRPAPPAEPEEGASRRAWWVWGVGVSAYVAALFHRASLGVAAPDAAQRFDVGPGVLALFSVVQLGVYLVLQVPSGIVADRWGPRRVIATGAAALAVGSAVFAISGSLLGGITGRLLIGIGDAFMFINVLRLAAKWFPPERYGKVAALTGLAGGAGQLVATVPLTTALHTWGWVSTFLSAALVTGVITILVLGAVRDRPVGDPAHSGTRESVKDMLWAVVRRRGTGHSFWVHAVFMSQFVVVTTLWGAPWLIEAQGFDSDGAGVLLMVCAAAFVVSAWCCAQWVAGRPQRRERFCVGLAVAVLGAWVSLVAWPGVLPTTLVITLLVVIGAGGGAAMLAFDGARYVNPVHQSGTASGVVNMGGFVGAVLMQVGIGAVLQATGALPAVEAYRWGFLPVVLMLAVGTAVQVRLRTRW